MSALSFTMPYRKGMRLVLDNDARALTIRSYESAAAVVGEQRLDTPFIISRGQLLRELPAGGPSAMDLAALQPVLALKPRALLMGADGASPSQVPRATRTALDNAGISLDVMSYGAACRTYNVLASEAREVVACLWMPGRSAPKEGTGRGDDLSTNQLPEADRIE